MSTTPAEFSFWDLTDQQRAENLRALLAGRPLPHTPPGQPAPATPCACVGNPERRLCLDCGAVI